MANDKLSRRDFLKFTGLSLSALTLTVEKAEAKNSHYLYRNWEDIYKQTLSWDSISYAFHCVNCKGNCAWKVYVKNGMVIREEQVAEYPQINPDIPDANPRGCNKGAVHSDSMYSRDRIKYPLKRVGNRGEGKWKRISWDQALEEIAEKMVDTILTNDDLRSANDDLIRKSAIVNHKSNNDHGLSSLMFHIGTGILSQGRRAGVLRLGSLLGAIRSYSASAVGDMFPGATLVFGTQLIGGTSDSWFESDYIILWCVNPIVSRIPDAHFITEARYRGCKVVSIAPDYNPSSIHADIWIPIKVGMDSLLAMSLINVILKERLYDEIFIKEQTDLPFLVRLDNRRILREEDIIEGGSSEIFYIWDKRSGKITEAPGSKGSTNNTLRLEGIDPAIEGRFKVKDYQDKEIGVTTVFELIKEEASRFPPEKTASLTGVHPDTVYQIAREFSKARKAKIITGYAMHKYFWGTLTFWGAALLCALTGHTARRGGLSTEPSWNIGGLGPLSSPKPARFSSGFLSEWFMGRLWETGFKHYDNKEEFSKAVGMTYEEIKDYADDVTFNKKWFPYFGEPKVCILFSDNRYRRNKSTKHYLEKTLAQLELFVYMDYRMNSTALWADYVLPAKSQYEEWDIRGDVGYHRFVNITSPATDPLWESRSEWEICRELAKSIAEVAKRRGITSIKDPEFNVTRDLDTLYEDFTDNGQILSDKDVVEWILRKVPAIEGWSLRNAMRKGFIIYNDEAGNTSPLYPDQTYSDFEPQVYLKRPYNTLSGRQTFYIDHDLYLKLGTQVPTARKPIRPSKYPFSFYTPHTRYGIHSTWRANRYMLRLQRGNPIIYINPGDAALKGIKDGDKVKVFNDIGHFYAMAKLVPSVAQNTLVMEHAWEPCQFEDGYCKNDVVAGIITPMELIGDFGHIVFSPEWDGNQLAFESSVDILP